MVNHTNEIQCIHDWNDRVGNVSTKRALHEPEVSMYYNLIREEFHELVDAFIQGDSKEVVDGAADLIVTSVGLLHMMGYNANDVLKLVNASNYSKFVNEANQDEVDASIMKYYFNTDYESVYIQNTVLWGTVCATGSKKVLKGSRYAPPQWDLIMQSDDISPKTGE